MALSNKRRLSVSQERDQDSKKRKIASTIASEPPVPLSPVLLPSDSSTTLVDDDSDSAPKNEVISVDITPILAEPERPLSPKGRGLPPNGDDDSAPKDKGKAVDRTPIWTDPEVPLSPKKRRLPPDSDAEEPKRRRTNHVATSDPSSSTSSPSPTRARSTSASISTLDSEALESNKDALSRREGEGKAVDRSSPSSTLEREALEAINDARDDKGKAIDRSPATATAAASTLEKEALEIIDATLSPRKDKGKAVDRSPPAPAEPEQPRKDGSHKKRALSSSEDLHCSSEDAQDAKRRKIEGIATCDPSSSTSGPGRAWVAQSSAVPLVSRSDETCVEGAISYKDKGKAVDRSPPQPTKLEQPRKAASHKKRSLSQSDDVHLSPEDAQYIKRRKLGGVATCDPSSSTSGPSHARGGVATCDPSSSTSGPSRTRVRQSSRSHDTYIGGASSFKDKGKAVDRTPVNPPTLITHTNAENPADPASSVIEVPANPAAVSLELERLRAELARASEILRQNEDMSKSILQALTCHVCLEVVTVPYALVPCGHIACHGCLVRWFGSPEQDQSNDEENPDIEWLSDEESEPEVEDPHPAAEPSENGTHTSATSVQNDGTHAVSFNPAPLEAPLPSEERIKTCPHCRCRILQRPIPAYAIRDILGILGTHPESTKRRGSKKKSKDPWDGVFPPDPDHGSGGGGGGGGGGSGGGGPSGYGGHGGAPGSNLPPTIGPSYSFSPFLTGPTSVPPLPPPLHDVEDGVRRCGMCFHELWRGSCTNTNCNVEYVIGGEPEMDSDDEVAFLSMLAIQADHGVTGDSGSEHPEANEDGYDSSFIDDDEEEEEEDLLPGPSRKHRYRPSGAVTDADDDDFLPGPSRRYGGGREAPIVISSDEEEPRLHPRRPSRGRGRSRQIFSEEEEEPRLHPRRPSRGHGRSREIFSEEEDEGEGSGVHFRLSVLEEDPRHEFLIQHESNTVAPPYIEEADDEDYGNEEVPYIWDINDDGIVEDDEDEEKGGYPQDEDEDEDEDEEDDRDGYES